MGREGGRLRERKRRRKGRREERKREKKGGKGGNLNYLETLASGTQGSWKKNIYQLLDN